VYNGYGRNLVFKTTPDKFPLRWELIGSLESRFFGIYGVDALYDEVIDKIILLANIFYPKPRGVEEPLKCVYHGVLLISLLRDTLSYPLRYRQNNVYAPGIAKVGRGRYVVLINCTEDGSVGSERIFRLDLGVEEEQTLHITNTYTTSRDLEYIMLLKSTARSQNNY